MPKRRRKLSRELESEIRNAIKKVEFITAVVNDIEDEEIQGEYRIAFEPIKACLVILSAEYDTNVLTEASQMAFSNFKFLVKKFEEEYEI